MNIGITGASGLIGGSLARSLNKNSSLEVVAIVRNSSDTSNLPSKVDIKYADITNLKQLEKSTKNLDVIFHCAAALPHHNLRPKEYQQINVIGTRNLLKAAVKNKVKHFIYISTVGIYNDPLDDYSATKLKAEKEVTKFQKKGLKTTIIRPTLVFGPFDTRPGFYNLFKLVQKGKFVPIANNNIHFHTLYIDNLINLLTQLPNNKKAYNEDFIIGDIPCPKLNDFIGEIYSASEKQVPKYKLPKLLALSASLFFTYIIKPLGYKVPLDMKRYRFITTSKKYKTDKAEKILKYKPKCNLEKSVKNTYKWYLKNRYI